MTVISDHSTGFAAEGGSHTARTSSTPADKAKCGRAYGRAQRAADGSGPKRSHSLRGRIPARPCPVCREDFFPAAKTQITCSRSCARKHGHTTAAKERSS